MKKLLLFLVLIHFAPTLYCAQAPKRILYANPDLPVTKKEFRTIGEHITQYKQKSPDGITLKAWISHKWYHEAQRTKKWKFITLYTQEYGSDAASVIYKELEDIYKKRAQPIKANLQLQIKK